MSTANREIRPADILPMAEFERIRDRKYADIRATKHNRRVDVGPFATLMFEIGDPVRRARELSRLGSVEATVTITIDGAQSAASAETDAERTTASGRTSSVHFVSFPLRLSQAAALQRPGAEVRLAIGHPAYRHIAQLAEATRAELANDLD